MQQIPEVRQCQDQDDQYFGCVAVASGVPHFVWGVFNPRTGGHWEDSNLFVKSWAVLSSVQHTADET